MTVVAIVETRGEEHQNSPRRNTELTGTLTQVIGIRGDIRNPSEDQRNEALAQSMGVVVMNEYASGSEEDRRREKKSKRRAGKQGSSSSDESSSDEYASGSEDDQGWKKHVHRRTKRHHHSSRTDSSIPHQILIILCTKGGAFHGQVVR